MRLPFRRARRSPAADAYRRSSPPSAKTPWREATYAAVDLETTGLDPRRDEIISFAAVPIEDGRVVAGRICTVLVRPRQMPDAETICIHGLRPVDLTDAPPLIEALDLILGSLTGRVLVAHPAWVERGFLRQALKSAGVRPKEPILDTSGLARSLLAERGVVSPRSLALSDTARELGLPVHRPHHADGDALTTAQLFLALVTHLDEVEPQTVGSLARLSGD